MELPYAEKASAPGDDALGIGVRVYVARYRRSEASALSGRFVCAQQVGS